MRQLITLTILLLSVISIFAQPSIQTAPADTSKPAKKLRWAPSPTVSALLSTAIPGAGQIYSRKYWHAPLFMAAEGYCAWRAYDSANKANDYWDLRNSLTQGTAQYAQAGADFENTVNDRNTYLWLLAGAKFFDIVDAYICAHLFDFDEQMNTPLSVRLLPDSDGGVALTLCLRF